MQQLRRIFIGIIEFSHTAKVPRRETRSVRVFGLEVFRGCDSSAFLGSGTDQPADLTVQLHLRQFSPHQVIQCGVHGTVVYRLSDIHEFLLSGDELPFWFYYKEKRGIAALFLVIDAFLEHVLR